MAILAQGRQEQRKPAGAEIRFVDLRAQRRALEPALSDAIAAVLDRGDFVLGEDVGKFEREFARFCGSAHAVGVDSGFSALELALRAAGVEPGDEVITQANTFVATVGAVMALGASPVLTDCDADGAVDPAAVADAVTAKTRVIIPVHMFGRMGDITAIQAVASRHGLTLIEDACQAHGARWQGRRAGSFGLAGAFSFYPGKNLGAFGDGGMLVTDSAAVADQVRMLRHYGQRIKYEHLTTPLNRRLDTIQAAVLRIKLPHLDTWTDRRRELARAYHGLLSGLPVVLPEPDDDGRHVYHLFVIQVERRDALRDALSAARIETGIHYPIPLHLQPALRHLGYRQGAFPHAERLAAHSLSLPMYPELPLTHVERVAATIRRHLRG